MVAERCHVVLAHLVLGLGRAQWVVASGMQVVLNTLGTGAQKFRGVNFDLALDDTRAHQKLRGSRRHFGSDARGSDARQSCVGKAKSVFLGEKKKKKIGQLTSL